jgi:hypothetical protein
MPRRATIVAGSVSAGLLFAVAAAEGCGSNSDQGSTYTEAGVSSGDGASSGGGASSGSGGASSGGSGDGGFSLGCSPLSSCQVHCPDAGPSTSLSGTVYDPAGKVPLYNVLVYIPTETLKPITTGATCDQCGAQATGNPLVTALTDAQGHFVLNNVPVGVQLPLVMQLGKWRRQVMVPAVTKQCGDTALTDKNLLRLPRNQSEGDIPLIAVATGGADPLECLLRKVGLSDSEFSTAGGTGRVHLYAGGGYTSGTTADAGGTAVNASSSFASSLNGGAPFASAQSLWSSFKADGGSQPSLSEYDILLLACEGQWNVATKPPAALQAMSDYENAGGRVFMSHWHDYWIEHGPAPLPSTGTFNDDPDSGSLYLPQPPPPQPFPSSIDTTFPKGQAFHDWLSNVGALDSSGLLDIFQARHNQNAVGASAQRWVYQPDPNTLPTPNEVAIEYMSFNTPIGVDAGAQCGRVVYSDLHVSGAVDAGDQTGQPFPNGCVTSDLSAQEKALEFMLFDLSSCIQSDSTMPMPM